MKSRFWITILAIALTGLTLWNSTSGQAPQKINRITKWEYKVRINSGIPQDAELNSIGNEGWELVSVTPEQPGNFAAVFKRMKR
jgi:hypothetical protein